MVQVVNPFRKIRCPACSQEFYPGDCAIVTSMSRTELQKARPGLFSRTFVTPLRGSKFVQGELAFRQCPNPQCGYLLPRNVESVESHTIAIVGDSTSGKSHYIASCIYQLKRALQVIGCSRIVGQGDTDLRYTRDYYNPVYRQGQQLILTPQASMTGAVNLPLVYELVFSEKSSLQPAKSLNLLFYDASGEDIVDQNLMVAYSHFILNASAIIFLADPLQMPGVIKALPSHLQPQVKRELTTGEVLNRVVQTFEQHHGIRPGKKLKVPIAITISKSDLVKFVFKGKHLPSFLSDSYYTNQLDIPKFDIISREVQKLLQDIDDQVLLHASELFEKVSFFAVSATGWPPDNNGQFPPLEPLRCLDPLLWALWQLDIINEA